MLLDTSRTSFDMQQIENRRFMYQPETQTLILGYQYKSSRLISSHAEEHFDSGAKEPFDSFIRGWIGTGKEYMDGIIHFAPHIDSRNTEAFEKAFSTLEMFRANNANCNTIVRGFGNTWEQPLQNILNERSDRMAEAKSGYSSYDYDHLDPADRMKIEHKIYFEESNADISPLTALPIEQLLTMRKEPPHGRNRRAKPFRLTKRLNM